jgi:hypothetical protein
MQQPDENTADVTTPEAGTDAPAETGWRSKLGAIEQEIAAEKNIDETPGVDADDAGDDDDVDAAQAAADESLDEFDDEDAGEVDQAAADDAEDAKLERPESPNDYTLPQIEGHEWSKADEPNLDSFLGVAHESGLSNDQAGALLSYYADLVVADDGAADLGEILTVAREAGIEDAAVGKVLGWVMQQAGGQPTDDAPHTDDAARVESDKADLKAARAELQRDLGADYKAQIASLKQSLTDNGLAEVLTTARSADGRLLLNDPDVVRSLIAHARGQQGTPTQTDKQIESREDAAQFWGEEAGNEWAFRQAARGRWSKRR